MRCVVAEVMVNNVKIHMRATTECNAQNGISILCNNNHNNSSVMHYESLLLTVDSHQRAAH